MSMVKEKNKTKLENDIELKIDYKSIDKRDVYGFYLTNLTTKNNKFQLPDIGSFVNIYPDFIALETEPGLYHKTKNSCICWFKDDSSFDKIDGLYNAIIYKNIPLLKYYKKRYNGVKFFISIDYSTYGDFDFEVLLHNIKKSIIVYLWLTFECDAIVYPLMTYGKEPTFNWCFTYIMQNSNVAVSLKGVMRGKERQLFIKALKVLIDTRKPKALIVYSDASLESTNEILNYAILNGIPIYIIPNTLQIRNIGGVE